MNKKLESSYSCWLIVNENNQPLYGDKDKKYKRLWFFINKKDAEDYLKETISKTNKKRYIIKAIMTDEANFSGNRLTISLN